MIKKIVIYCLILGFIFPNFTHAAFAAPYLDINISVVSESGEGTFNFNLYQTWPSSLSLGAKEVKTQNGLGALTFSPSAGYGQGFKLEEIKTEGWEVASIECFTLNPLVTYFTYQESVSINAAPYSSINCTFKNRKLSSKNPVLIIPGTTATELFKGDEKLWLDIDRLSFNNSDNFMDPLAFTKDAKPIDESLTLGDVLGNPKNKFDYSESLVNEFVNNGYELNKNLFLFSYDWRKEIDENAQGVLKTKIDELAFQSPSGKIDIIAHSQGGLLIKRLIYDKPEYISKINKLIFVGTPNLGSPKSFKILRDGDSLGVAGYGLGLDPGEVKKISQNMPSIYEMLPSREYFNHYSGYWGELDRHLLKPDEEIVYNYETTKRKQKEAGYNESLLGLADAFHISDFDNYDFSNLGMDVTNIVGCQTPTYAGFIDKTLSRDKILWEPGDDTVPIKSANNMFGVNTVYSQDASHGTMLTNAGVKQKIINLITGSNDATSNITENISDCKFNGTAVASHSPVDLHIYDSQGRHVGLNFDGSFDGQIPNVGFEVIGHENFAFLPEGENYTVKLLANDSGSFSFDSSQVNQGQVVNTTYYDSIGITASSTAQINLNSSNNQNIILDLNGDGSLIKNIPPSAILNQNESLDLNPPISTSTISGLVGEQGYYRSDVQVGLSATDPVIAGHENQTSGVLGIKYSLDEAGYFGYSSTTPILVTSEGHHTIKFFATDRAGNNETPQEVNFVIDKTAPEFQITFDTNINDIVFTATDTSPTLLNSSSTTISKLKKWPKLVDSENVVTATDAAGNITVLTLKEKDRKKNARAEIKSLSYNGITADILKTNLNFSWQLDKKQNLKELNQRVKSKKDFNIEAEFENGKTKIEGKDSSGKINQTLNGLKILKILTNKGDFNWSF